MTFKKVNLKMGIIYIEMKVKNPKNTRKEKKIKFLVDSGVTLEAPGFIINPLNRKLEPLPL